MAPLVSKPAIQNYIAQKVTKEIMDNAPTQNLATTLLPAIDINGGQSTDQLKNLLNPVIQNTVINIVKSPSFAHTMAHYESIS